MKTHAAMFCLGVWVMGTVCVSIAAMQNFYTIDRLLDGPSHPAFTAFVEGTGREDARNVLRYLSSELNRLFFQLWNVAQLALGGGALWLVWRLRAPGAARLRRLVLAMLAVVVILAVGITPQILAIGRGIDFVPRDPPPPGGSRVRRPARRVHAAGARQVRCGVDRRVLAGTPGTRGRGLTSRRPFLTRHPGRSPSPWLATSGRPRRPPCR